MELLELAHPWRIPLPHPLDAARQALGCAVLDSIPRRFTHTDRSQIEDLTLERTRAEVFRRLVQPVFGSGSVRRARDMGYGRRDSHTGPSRHYRESRRGSSTAFDSVTDSTLAREEKTGKYLPSAQEANRSR